jgi:phosphoenolpyruvate-protein phosphotransferase (PTS system enzyme I)
MPRRSAYAPQMTDAPRQIVGTPVVPGVAYGPFLRYIAGVDLDAVESSGALSGEDEVERFTDAAKVVADRLAERAEAATGAAAEVLTASVGLVRDRGLHAAVAKQINSGATAERAVIDAVEQFAEKFAQLGGLMAERVTDVRDVGRRLVAQLLGVPAPGLPVFETASILVAEDLAPADTAGLDPTLVLALVTRLGGPTSHTAIIARQLGLPCIVAADISGIPDGSTLLVDGTTGVITVEPDPAAAQERLADADRLRRSTESWSGPGRTSDGHDVALLANVQDGASAREAAQAPCEGVGLFRTELCFLGRDTEPAVEEQTSIYAEVLSAFKGRKVVIRTLDAGSDKPMRFAGLPDEDNPALGIRGLRIAGRDKGLLTRQLDAVAAAARSTGESPMVMAPMVATPDEARFFAEEVRGRDLSPGVMIEVPAAALLADRILETVDFVSIGTNDLSQYTMAADRLSGELAGLTDAWQPAVLRLIQMTARAGEEAGKPVGVCGEAAADPMLGCVLVGLGITSLSMARSALAAVGVQLAEVSMAQCEEAAQAALDAIDPPAGRLAAREVLLGG